MQPKVLARFGSPILRDAAVVGRQEGWGPETITPGSWLFEAARDHAQEYSQRCFRTSAVRLPIEGLHPETGTGVYEAAIYKRGDEAADR